MVQGLTTLILILMPMFLGFLLPKNNALLVLSEKGLYVLVFMILFVIGMELGMVGDLSQKMGDIALYLISLMFLTIGFGIVSLMIFDYFFSKITIKKSQKHIHKSSMKGSMVQLLFLGAGFIFSKYIYQDGHLPNHTITALLMVLLLLVGISLKGSDVSLKQAIFNKQGLQISVIFTIATLFGGAVFASMFADVSLSMGLALASGFGWYSLSGTIMTDAYGAIWGGVALLNDLGREILALLFIPMLMRYSPSSAIGLGGVTSLDFTLPTLTQAGGVQIVPMVISFGFITNVISPMLMVFFANLS